MRPRYTVNCSLLFTDLPLLERPAAAKAAGFDAVEFWRPFSVAVPRNRDIDGFAAAVIDAGMTLAGLNFFAGTCPAVTGGWSRGRARR
jgi:hydroxypyruvate isomerase